MSFEKVNDLFIEFITENIDLFVGDSREEMQEDILSKWKNIDMN